MALLGSFCPFVLSALIFSVWLVRRAAEVDGGFAWKFLSVCPFCFDIFCVVVVLLV